MNMKAKNWIKRGGGKIYNNTRICQYENKNGMESKKNKKQKKNHNFLNLR